jgi:hypothetical protein
MKTLKTGLPTNSLLYHNRQQYDYVDSFEGSLKDYSNQFTSVDVAKAFFSSSPKWIEKLFAFRNKLVSVFELKTSGKITDRAQQLNNFKCEKGESFGLFKVFNKTDNEVILGEDDKHLNFRVSLHLSGQGSVSSKRNLTISTTVVFNNWFGRLYFMPVRPFHALIVPSMLKAVIKELESKQI